MGVGFTILWTAIGLGLALFFDDPQMRIVFYGLIAFSLVYWIVDAIGLVKLLKLIRCRRTVDVTATDMLVEETVLGRVKQKIIPTARVHSARLSERSAQQAQASWPTFDPELEIVAGGGSIFIPLNSQAEVLWAAQHINSFLQSHR
jgi:hypothetical protein